jgi:hypothetical protein
MFFQETERDAGVPNKRQVKKAGNNDEGIAGLKKTEDEYLGQLIKNDDR